MKITVVTPVLNGVTNIRDCLESVRAQNYADIEHIVIDGGSTDGTLDIVREYNINFISERDAGIYDAFNKGIDAANGEIVHILNADDTYANSGCITSVMTLMKEHRLDLCHGYAEQIKPSGALFRRIGRNIERRELFAKMRVAHPSTFVAKAVYTRYGAYSVGFKIAADQDFLLRVWNKVKIEFIPETIVRMRVGGISTSQFVRSYRESMAAAIINGQHPLTAYTRYNYEIAKNTVLSFIK